MQPPPTRMQVSRMKLQPPVLQWASSLAVSVPPLAKAGSIADPDNLPFFYKPEADSPWTTRRGLEQSSDFASEALWCSIRLLCVSALSSPKTLSRAIFAILKSAPHQGWGTRLGRVATVQMGSYEFFVAA